MLARNTRVSPFPAEQSVSNSLHKISSSAGCSALQNNVPFMKQTSGKFLLSCHHFKAEHCSSILTYS